MPRKTEKRIPMTVLVSPELKGQLDDLAAEKEVSTALLIRLVLKDYAETGRLRLVAEQHRTAASED